MALTKYVRIMSAPAASPSATTGSIRFACQDQLDTHFCTVNYPRFSFAQVAARLSRSEILALMIRGIPRSGSGSLRRCLVILSSIGLVFASVVSLAPKPPLSGIQLPSDHKSILPAERIGITVPPPATEQIAVPEQYRGIHTVHDKEGQPHEVDFTAAYGDGFIAGWGSILAGFRTGKLDLDEVSPGRIEDLVELVQSINGVGGEPYYPGELAGAAACRDALQALAQDRGLVYLPARPPWLKQLAARGCQIALNNAGRPILLWWTHIPHNQKLGDADFRILQDVPIDELTRLEIKFVPVTDDVLSRLSPMPKLTELDFYSTQLTGACLHALYRSPLLKEVRLAGLRSVSTADLAVLGKLEELELLDLGAVAVEDDAVPVIVGLPKLSILILDWANDGSGGPKLTPVAIRQLGECRNLEHLSLSGCAVDDRTLIVLASKIPKLTGLSIAKTQVTDASIGSIQKLQRLESFNFARTRVTDTGIALLAAHPSLETLSLEKTLVGDPALATLLTMPKLKEVWVGRNQFSESAIAAFKKARPNTRIKFADR